ncbi:MAG: hypothetical protein GY801_41290 [bacterium]|nr:hypothetical protein [bacterium]
MCDLYQQAPALHEQGEHVLSTDDKPGIQAVERDHPTHPAEPGGVQSNFYHILVDRYDFGNFSINCLSWTPLKGWCMELLLSIFGGLSEKISLRVSHFFLLDNLELSGIFLL